MTNVKCIRCGVLNNGTAHICRVCEIELNTAPPNPAGPIPFQFHQANTQFGNPDAGAVTIDSIGPFEEVGDVLGPTLTLFQRNIWLITKIVVVIVAPFEIFRTLNVDQTAENWQLNTGVFLLDVMCRILIAPALIYALMQVMQTGTAPGVNEAYRWGLTKLGKLAVCAVIAFILQMLGAMLCIIPGIVVYLSFTVVYPIAVLEQSSIPQVLERSYEFTKGHRWKILGASIVLWLLMLLFSLPEAAAQAFAADTGGLWPLYLLAAIFGDIMEQSTTVLSLVTYLSIRALWSQRSQ